MSPASRTDPSVVVWYATIVIVNIPLGDNLHAIVDKADEALVSGFAWRVFHHPHGMTYAHAWNGKQHYYMHRLIAGAGHRELVDHENRNGLDNRRRNLRVATPGQNGANRKADNRKAGRTSRYKGVFWDKNRQRWMATIHVDGKTRSLGRFPDEELAAAAYDAAATEAWGDFARLNLEP